MGANDTAAADGEMGSVPDSPQLVTLVKMIGDLEDLIRVLKRGLSRAKPWQRQLASRLADVDCVLGLLRLTIAMERSDAEIRSLADTLCAECRAVGLAVAGSRADRPTKAAVNLIARLADATCDALGQSALNPSLCTKTDAAVSDPIS